MTAPGRGWALAAGLALAAATAGAGLQIDCRLAQSTVIQFEPVEAFVTIINATDVELRSDSDAKTGRVPLRLEVERHPDGAAGLLDQTPIVAALTLRPGERREFMVDVAQRHDIRAVGRYLVRAVVLWNGREYRTEATALEVVNGIELAQFSHTVPGYEDRTRLFSLRYWAREQGEHLFLRVDEPETGINYGVFYLGRLVRVFKPVIRPERDGRIVVLHQAGRDLFTRTTFRTTNENVIMTHQDYFDNNGEPYNSAGAGGGAGGTDESGAGADKPKDTPVPPAEHKAGARRS